MKRFAAGLAVLAAGFAGLAAGPTYAAPPAPASGTMAPPPTARHAGHKTGHDMAGAQALRKSGTQGQKQGSS